MASYRVELPAGCTEVTLVRAEDGSETVVRFGVDTADGPVLRDDVARRLREYLGREPGSEAPALVDFMVRRLGFQVGPLAARAPIRLTVMDRRAVTLWVGASTVVSASKRQTAFALTLPGAVQKDDARVLFRLGSPGTDGQAVVRAFRDWAGA
ncbi:hypothetical protein ACFFQW_17425 [Umezawaea endophytica]|uniref:Uncharacterized protein n=1 Tax=Umezawaea endophytica TaxID=1654476 RepID=A0A9X2VUV8_9PSEU|nr:hypothetical protein [Umezawaea endophytica]MCS7482772.1 hypothetical protein [Umezawaea endophytica]